MSQTLIPHFQVLGRNNRAANERLYGVCAQLSDSERHRRAFFGNIHGTLNHIMVGDRIWLTRFEGGEIGSTALDSILYQDFEALHVARIAEDRRIEAFATTIDAEFLEGTVEYENNEGRLLSDPVDLLVAHFFNHQTHHRGQAHALLTAFGSVTQSTDLLVTPVEN